MRTTVIKRFTRSTKSKSPASRKRESTGTMTRSSVAKLLRMPSWRTRSPSLRDRIAAEFMARCVAVKPKHAHQQTMEFYASSENEWTQGLSQKQTQESKDDWPIAV